MMFAYDRIYLADAMAVLAEFFDYAVSDYGAEGDEVADLFCISSLSDMFAKGNPSVVSGMSGPELFERLSVELGYDDAVLPKPLFRFEKTPDYWAGWVAAFIQWRLGISFDELFRIMPYDDLIRLYHPWHEASEERFCELFIEWARDSEARTPTRLACLRSELRLSQRELAYRSGVGLRSIQMYEQRQKDINKAQAQTLLRLSRVLYCSMEDLMEPVFELDEVA